jgi:hypothetical protein
MGFVALTTEKVIEGRVCATQQVVFSADKGVGVGIEARKAVAPDCSPKSSAFTGEINWVELEVGDDDHSHMLDPEEHTRVLMGRQ